MNRFGLGYAALMLPCIFVTAAHAAVLEDFENTSDLATNFNVGSSQGGTVSNTSGTSYSGRPVIGTNGVVPVGDATGTYKASTFSLAVGKSITESIFLTQTQATTGSQVLIELGFGTASTDVFNNGTTGSFASIFSRLYSINNTQYKLLTDNKNSYTAAAAEATGVATITLTGNGTSYTPFYLYTETLSRTDTGSFTSSGTLSFYGTSVSNTPTTVGSFSIGYQNTLLGSAADAGTLYGGFRSNGNGGAYTLDNFSVSDPFVTPEPASLGIFACAAVIFGRRRRPAAVSAL